MKQKSLPIIITQDSCARRLFRIVAPDQYAAKYIALYLMDRGIHFFFLGSFLGTCQGEICFSVPKNEETEIESFLATLPTARPASAEYLATHLYAGADAGRLDLAHSRRAVAQVTGHEDTQYLADIWNAFAPDSQSETVINTAPIPALPLSVP
jgi:hypothetical protein